MGDDDFTISESLNPVSQFAIENGLQKDAEYMKVLSVRIYVFLYLCVHPQKVCCTVSVTDCMYVYTHFYLLCLHISSLIVKSLKDVTVKRRVETCDSGVKDALWLVY